MSKKRSAAELTVHSGPHLTIEWYWNPRNEMPGLDAYLGLDEDTQARFLASISLLSETRRGEQVSTTLVNVEHTKPLILAVKAIKSRFPCFHAAGAKVVITGQYIKHGEKLDKRGERAICEALVAREDYLLRNNDGVYYRRGEKK